MANFLITTPNSLTEGTDTADLFELRTGAGVSIVAAAGADIVSASSNVFTAANLQAGAGDDEINFSVSGVLLDNAVIQLGAGNDVVDVIDGARAGASSARGGLDITGGGGDDDIIIRSGANFGGGTSINGNAGSDQIFIDPDVTLTNSLVAGGGDSDDIFANNGINFSSSSLNGGGGADFITVSGTVSNSFIQADNLNDTQFFGDDLVLIEGNFGSGSTVIGGGGNDLIDVGADFTTGGSTVNGNDGNDEILINAFAGSGGTFVGGGAGVDTITVSTLADNFGTIQGGGGVDSITVSALAFNGGFIFGGDAADTIGLGEILSGAGGAAASGVNVGYASFSESTLGSVDVISADSTGQSGGAASFVISQDVTNFSVVAFSGNGVTGNAAGQAVFSGVADTLTARATLLDATLVNGNAVTFTAGGSTYLFVQGGAAGSGTSGDLLVQLNGDAAAGVVAATGSIARVSNSQLKVNF